jgi:CO/xanthine dehydrogenase FAD-binding subunit
MNFRLMRPSYLLDINGLEELAKVRVGRLKVTLGSMARHRDIEYSPQVARQLPILTEAIRLVGHPAIRNRGTVGGSLVHADPAAELPLITLALDAEIQLRSKKGSRTLKPEEFYLGYLTTAIAPDELLVRISLQTPPKGTGWCFTEFTRRHGDFAIIAVAALLGLDKQGKTVFSRIALGGVGPAPVRSTGAEQLLMGKQPSDALFREAGELVASEIDPEGDIHASSGYRKHLSTVLVRRALETAQTRAG